MLPMIYVDNNATTQIAPEAVDAMLPFLTEFYGNPSATYPFAVKARQHLSIAREQVSALLGCQPDEVIFTSGGTESNNWAIHGLLDLAPPGKRHVLTTQVEHLSVKEPIARLAAQGFQITELKVNDEGMINLKELESLVTSEVALVSIMYANNETGVVFPISAIGQLLRQKGVIFHVDAVQAVGKIPVDLHSSAIDSLSVSAHKLHGPKGIGALYIRNGIAIRPQIVGGNQEFGYRAGTESVANIVGFGCAAELASKCLLTEYPRIRAMRDRLEAWILEHIDGSRINGVGNNRLPNTVNISFEFLESEAILKLLAAVGVYASSGSACTSDNLDPSHVLKAMRVPIRFIHGAIRFSLSKYNTEGDIDYVIDHLPSIIEKSRRGP